jgi:hypothetical protein
MSIDRGDIQFGNELLQPEAIGTLCACVECGVRVAVSRSLISRAGLPAVWEVQPKKVEHVDFATALLNECCNEMYSFRVSYVNLASGEPNAPEVSVASKVWYKISFAVFDGERGSGRR